MPKKTLPTWEEVHELSLKKLEKLADEHDLDMSKREFADEEAVANYICKKLDIEEEEAPRSKKGKSKLKSKKSEVTYESLMEMGEEEDEDGLAAAAEKAEFEEDPDDYGTWTKFAEALAEHMELEAKGGGEEKPTWEEVHELSEKQMTKLIKDNELDIDPDDYAEWDEVADAICEEMEIEEEEKASKKGKKKKESKLPTHAEVTEMGEEEDEEGLTALIEKHDLDIDPDDHETWEGAAEAVIEALELEPEKEEELPSFKEVHGMDEDELTKFATDNDVDLDKEFDTLEGAADFVCEELEIEAPKKKGKLGKLKKKSKK